MAAHHDRNRSGPGVYGTIKERDVGVRACFHTPGHRAIKSHALRGVCEEWRKKYMSRRSADKLPEMVENHGPTTTWLGAREEFSIAHEIIRSRVTAGMSQKELAEKIGTTQSAIARLESGDHTPSVSTLKRVAAATDTQLHIKLIPSAGRTPTSL